MNRKPDEGYLQRTDKELKRERINRIIAGIAVNRPHWASEPPWVAEKFLEGNGGKLHRSLFTEGGSNE